MTGTALRAWLRSPEPETVRVPRRRLHQVVFLLAGFYNICWGIFSALYPQWLFDFAKMPPINYPQIFACVGMIVGVYGVLYWEIARRPEHGWLLAAIGLLGKVLGPLGLAPLILTGQWPFATLILCLTNDLIWWIPFALYLWDAWPAFRRTLGVSGTDVSSDATSARG